MELTSTHLSYYLFVCPDLFLSFRSRWDFFNPSNPHDKLEHRHFQFAFAFALSSQKITRLTPMNNSNLVQIISNTQLWSYSLNNANRLRHFLVLARRHKCYYVQILVYRKGILSSWKNSITV